MTADTGGLPLFQAHALRQRSADHKQAAVELELIERNTVSLEALRSEIRAQAERMRLRAAYMQDEAAVLEDAVRAQQQAERDAAKVEGAKRRKKEKEGR